MLNLQKEKKYLLACSFGPDSMALFYMLKNEGYNFDVAHVNYHYRNESNFEENQLRQYCENNHINIYVYDNKKNPKGNLENEARNIRYNYFLDLYRANHYDALLVAHNEDDHIETYIMQKKTGIYVKYYGIKDISYYQEMQIIRPLLNYSKQYLLSYCNDNNIPYSIDSSNLDTSYLRNKIRIEIVSKYSNEERMTILKEIKEENIRLNELISGINFTKSNDVNYLKSLDEDSLNYVLQYLINQIGIYHLSKKNVVEIKKIINSSKPNVTLCYRDYYLKKEYDKIYFSKDDEVVSYSYVIDCPKIIDTPYFYLDFTGDTSSRNVKNDDYPLTIRNALKKDQIMINDYKVEVRRLFIDWKMPLSIRKRWPVIVNKNNEVIYIPRYQKDFVVTPTTNFYVKY